MLFDEGEGGVQFFDQQCRQNKRQAQPQRIGHEKQHPLDRRTGCSGKRQRRTEKRTDAGCQADRIDHPEQKRRYNGIRSASALHSPEERKPYELEIRKAEHNDQTLSGLDSSYTDFVRGTLFTIGGVAVPKYVLYSVILTAIMWVIWNKTKFGKNMFAVGSNEEAANVSGVNVFWTIVLVFVLAGAMYGITGFIEGARIASCSANTGLNYESDAIAACVIGGVSFVGGTGKISGIVIGVFLLQIIFVGLNFLSVDANMLYVIKGLIILVACAIDMRKYLARK